MTESVAEVNLTWDDLGPLAPISERELEIAKVAAAKGWSVGRQHGIEWVVRNTAEILKDPALMRKHLPGAWKLAAKEGWDLAIEKRAAGTVGPAMTPEQMIELAKALKPADVSIELPPPSTTPVNVTVNGEEEGKYKKVFDDLEDGATYRFEEINEEDGRLVRLTKGDGAR